MNTIIVNAMGDQCPIPVVKTMKAIANDMTAEQLLLAMRPHPTFEEVLSEAMEDLIEKLGK